MNTADLETAVRTTGLDATDWAALGTVMSAKEHPRGTVLVEEGDLPTTFHVILEGNVTVHANGRHLADLGPGDYFGEIGVLSLENRNASVIATTPVRVAVAMGWDLRTLLDQKPDLKDKLLQAAEDRSNND